MFILDLDVAEEAKKRMCMVMKEGKLVSYACKICKKSYMHKETFRRHIRYQCAGKQPLYECHICPHKAYYKHNLKRHVITKHGPHFYNE